MKEMHKENFYNILIDESDNNKPDIEVKLKNQYNEDSLKLIEVKIYSTKHYARRNSKVLLNHISNKTENIDNKNIKTITLLNKYYILERLQNKTLEELL